MNWLISAAALLLLMLSRVNGFCAVPRNVIRSHPIILLQPPCTKNVGKDIIDRKCRIFMGGTSENVPESGINPQQTSSSTQALLRRLYSLSNFDALVKASARLNSTFGRRISEAKSNFKTNPWQYLSIPIVAAFVGYITNYLGVSMLFYPIKWRGIPIMRWPEQPFGLIGWQGVVPSKRFRMASTMVDVTISRLLKIPEVFNLLDASKIASILSPQVKDVVFGGLMPLPLVRFYLRKVSRDMIKNIESILDVKALVVEGMTTDPRILGSFFQRVGAKELSFLVESGTYFGFLLGLLQMLQWILFPKNWTLPVGGAIVGYVTNWIALKWIFEPLNPTRVGPFVLQGLFLRRQKEVSAEFSSYISENVLNSQQVWTSLLADGKKEGFMKIIGRNVPFLYRGGQKQVVDRLRSQLTGLSSIHGTANDVAASAVASAAAASANNHELHQYINKRLGLQQLLTERMNRLSPEQFEQVLHPIFQEDELTLILAGGVLGLIAGLAQWWLNVYLEKRNSPKLQSSTDSNGPNSTDGPPLQVA